MNTVTTFLLHVVKLAIGFLLALFPLHQLAAQDAGAEEKKSVRITMIKAVDGKTQVIDTTMQVAEHAEWLQLEREIKADTAALRKLKGMWVQILLDSTMSVIPHEALLDKIKVLRTDTLASHSLPNDGIIKSGTDSAATTIYIKELNNAGFARDTTDVVIRAVHPDVRLQISKHRPVILRMEDSTLSAVEPVNIKRIVVRKSGSGMPLDSLVAPESAHVRFNVIRYEETGEQKVYIIDDNGRKEEVKADFLKLGDSNARIVIVLKAKVEEMTAADRQALKGVSATVETKRREALDVEEISFYPNPNNGRFNLSFTLEDKGTSRISIMDSNREEVFVDTVEKLSGQYSRQIDLTPCDPGIYYLQIRQGQKYHTKKILVQ